ncbi:MAG: lysophospholipid acyltransferase family protein [Alcanivoracaceae bacterium]|nr:lysophospholipid acyltransferase family protein [Alcanivoracaceae bacterium]
MKTFIFITILRLSKILGLKRSRSFARFLGKISWKLAKKNRHITLTNIKKCYPHLSHAQQQQLAKESINATLMNMMELGKIWDQKTNIDDFIDNIYGIDDFSAALDQGNGLLLAVPHMGNWEVLNLILAQFDKFAFLYKPPTDKKIEEKLVTFRGKSKALQIEANIKGVRKIMLHLKDKGFVGILPDQRPKGGQGVFAPFYNIPTYTMSLFSKLAIKTKVPVYFAYALRSKNGFDIYFEKSEERIYADVETSVAYMNEKIQSIVDKAPEQYQWTYKRFSIQPNGEAPFY